VGSGKAEVGSWNSDPLSSQTKGPSVFAWLRRDKMRRQACGSGNLLKMPFVNRHKGKILIDEDRPWFAAPNMANPQDLMY